MRLRRRWGVSATVMACASVITAAITACTAPAVPGATAQPTPAAAATTARAVPAACTAPALPGGTAQPVPAAWRPAGSVPADARPASAPYYLTSLAGQAGAAEVVNGFTGKQLATISLPGRAGITGIAAAADDRTFFLVTGLQVDELRLTGTGRPAWLIKVRTLPSSAVPPYAVSADGSQLAYATPTGIVAVSLAAGTSRSWATAAGQAASNLSWGGCHTLVFSFQSTAPGSARANGVRVLDTSASGRDLLAASRLIIPAHVVHKTVGDLSGPFNPVATPDGSKVFATAWTGPPGELMVELAEFSAQTGQQLAVVIPPTAMPGSGFACVPLWTDPSGAHAIATCGVTGTIDNGVFTPTGLDVPGASGSGIGPLTGIAW